MFKENVVKIAHLISKEHGKNTHLISKERAKNYTSYLKKAW